MPSLEQEWRALLLSKMEKLETKIDKINDEMATLKVKVALFSSAIASIATIIAKKFIG